MVSLLGYGLVIDAVFAYAVFQIGLFFLSFLKVSDLKKKAVLITGCDTGFGKMTTLRLDALGMKVLAGCLTKQGIEDLKKEGSSNVFPFLLDVTKQESVEEAVELLKKEIPSDGLHALINNAGVLRGGLLEIAPISDWRLQLEVNVIGIANVTKAFLPFLRKAKGRIINIASASGIFATSGTSAYNASKFAVEGLSDAWRRELGMWGIKVSVIEPGIMKTQLWDVPLSDAHFDKMFNSMTPAQRELYGKDYFIQGRKKASDFVSKIGGDPKQVVDTLVNVTTCLVPHHRYRIGLDANFLFVPLSYLPSSISDFLWNIISPEELPASLKKK